MMFYVMGWIGVGACAALLADAKGRSAVRWLVLGAFFGPLATAAACLMPSVHVKDEDSAAPARRLCPHCANVIAPSARMCRWCRRIV